MRKIEHNEKYNQSSCVQLLLQFTKTTRTYSLHLWAQHRRHDDIRNPFYKQKLCKNSTLYHLWHSSGKSRDVSAIIIRNNIKHHLHILCTCLYPSYNGLIRNLEMNQYKCQKPPTKYNFSWTIGKPFPNSRK